MQLVYSIMILLQYKNEIREVENVSLVHSGLQCSSGDFILFTVKQNVCSQNKKKRKKE